MKLPGAGLHGCDVEGVQPFLLLRVAHLGQRDKSGEWKRMRNVDNQLKLKGLSNYKNWRQSVMTLKQEISGAELYYSKIYSSFRWLSGDG